MGRKLVNDEGLPYWCADDGYFCDIQPDRTCGYCSNVFDANGDVMQPPEAAKA